MTYQTALLDEAYSLARRKLTLAAQRVGQEDRLVPILARLELIYEREKALASEASPAISGKRVLGEAEVTIAAAFPVALNIIAEAQAEDEQEAPNA